MGEISFNSIPILLRTPGSYVEYDGSRAVRGVAALPNRILLIGAQETGESAANTLQEVTRKTDGIRLFGRRSQLSQMIEAAKGANTLTEMWAVGMADAGGATASQWTLVFSGTSTAAGSVYLYIAGKRIAVAIPSGTAAASVGPLVEAAIDLELDSLFTAGVATTTVTLTSAAAGEWTSDLDVRLNYNDREALPPGLSCAVTQTVVGATNPTLQTVLDLLPEEQFFTHVIVGFSDDTNVDALEAWALSKWGPLVQQDVHAFVGISGSFATMSSYGQARNSQFSTAFQVGLSPTPEHTYAAVVGAVDAAEPDPARPRQTLLLPGVLPAARADRLTQTERNLLLQRGISTHNVDQAGNVSIERLITTYQTNASAVADTTYLDVTTMHTLMALRYTLNARIRTKYPRHKLASDGTLVGPGQPVVTPSVIKGEILAIYDQWADLGWVEGGAKEQFKAELLVQRNGTDVNRIDAVIPPDLMNQFMVFAGQIGFLL